MASNPPVITRFAPSPTGHLHIGGARTALFCWAFARRHGGHFLLRIEDTDAARSSNESAYGIMEDLAWLGIKWDEGPGLPGETDRDPRAVAPFFQAQRVETYTKYFLDLVARGKAYPAFEPAEELEAKRKAAVAAKQTYRYDRASWHAIPTPEARLSRMKEADAKNEPYVIRFFAPNEEVVVHDQVLGDVKYAAGEMDDFVIRKADGFPTYHFAVVIDDELMGVTHVLRAQEHLNNTPRHVALQRALVRLDTGRPFRTPVYGHMPLICNMDGSKMSKRDKAKAARQKLQERMKQGVTLEQAADLLQMNVQDVSDFLEKKNDSLETAERIAHQFAAVLPEIEVSDFRENGYLPEAICNFLSLLGWNPGMKQPDGKDLEKFDNAFLAEHFSIERIGKTSAKFDRAKLLSFNADAINAMSDAAFAERWRAWCEEYKPEFAKRVGAAENWLMLAKAVKARAKTLQDGIKACDFLVRPDGSTAFDNAAVQKNLLANDRAGLKLLAEFKDRLAALEPFTPASIHAAMESFAKEKGFVTEKGVNVGPVAQPVRVAIAGVPVTPPLGETLAVLGKDSVLRRLECCLEANRG
jgi:glutamyl-tRNA synthetase